MKYRVGQVVIDNLTEMNFVLINFNKGMYTAINIKQEHLSKWFIYMFDEKQLNRYFKIE